MKVLVDTCIWSLALRRKKPGKQEIIKELSELINEVRVQFIGPIRQELLSGIKLKKHYDNLKHHLKAFNDINIETADYELAADYYNMARKKGIQGSNTDFLICAVSTRRDMAVFTTDNDFINFSKILPIKLHQIRN